MFVVLLVMTAVTMCIGHSKLELERGGMQSSSGLEESGKKACTK